MDSSRDNLEKEPEQIRRNIEGTRAALSDKLGRLESEVRGTVREARDVVGEGIEKVKETVSLSHQVNERPWTFFAGSIVLGAAVGHMLSKHGAHHEHTRGSSLADRLVPMFDAELKMVKGAAFTMLIGMMRDVARETIKPALSEMMDGAVQRFLGGAETVGANGR